ncbi:G-protein coupled receptor 1 [Nibea albiflora]|uniref:G-protein coupled receptor 1 n=1 Tax=Nibea albiflora TaxID=240163 RepID=A0ACB7EFP8_NIBAL|nr:G-protein coupled receptor 1 [Nibea albiflora]
MDDTGEDYTNYTYEYYMEYGDLEELKVEHKQRETMHIISVVIYIISFVLGLIGNGTVIWVTAIDRYISLVHLNWSQKYRTVEKAWVVCGCIWVLAAAMSCPALIFRDTMRLHDKVVCFNNFHAQDGHTAAMRHIIIVAIRTTVGFLLPFTAICVTGILLTIKVNRSGGSVHVSSFSKTVSAVILAFFLCWAPFHTFSLMELSIHSSLYLHNILKAGFPLATSLGFFNSCINPLLYMLLGKKVRRILKRACFDLTKSSLKELSLSVSATEIESVPGVHQDSVPEEPVELSTL